MKSKRLVVAGIFLALFTSAPVFSLPGLTGAKVASLLQSMQGAWHLACAPNKSSASYQRVQLQVSFTQLNFQVSHFADGQCRQLKHTETARYAFKVGEELVLAGGDRAFALYLTPAEAGSVAYPLVSRNLLHYRQGQLIFGKSTGETAHGEANRLDYGAAFSR